MTNQERMRVLLDQRAEQARRRGEQAQSRHGNALARDVWWGSRRSSKMRSRSKRSA